jgi:hypothetical protein
MRVAAEVYKGIEFVRISNLPEEQRQKITLAISKEKIIKILKDKKIYGDCIQYPDYLRWYEGQYKLKSKTSDSNHKARPSGSFNLALE